MDSAKTHTFTGGHMTLLRNDVLILDFNDTDIVEVEHVEACLNKRLELIGDVPFYLIVDLRNGFLSFSKEAKKWTAENPDSTDYRILDIALVSNWGMQLEVMVYNRLFRPKVPSKVVRSYDKALEEIEKHKKENS